MHTPKLASRVPTPPPTPRHAPLQKAALERTSKDEGDSEVESEEEEEEKSGSELSTHSPVAARTSDDAARPRPPLLLLLQRA